MVVHLMDGGWVMEVAHQSINTPVGACVRLAGEDFSRWKMMVSTGTNVSTGSVAILAQEIVDQASEADRVLHVILAAGSRVAERL